jgi:hypothetical protein
MAIAVGMPQWYKEEKLEDRERERRRERSVLFNDVNC